MDFTGFSILGSLLVILSQPVEDGNSKNCPAPTLVFERESKEMTELDWAHVETASRRCPELYGEDYCLVKLTMKENQAYVAICGKRR